MAVVPSLGGVIRYDPAKDFALVAIVTHGFPVLLVNPATGIQSVAELVARAKGNPNELTCSTDGYGAVSHLACSWFAHSAGIKIRAVAYKGGAAAALDAAAGVVHLFVGYPVGVLKQYVEPGKLRPLAVLGPERMAVMPNVPTMTEAGYAGIEVPGWVGVIAPAGTPKSILVRLNAGSIKAMRDPVIAEALRVSGGTSPTWTPEVSTEFVRKEREKWKRVSDETGIKAEQ